MGTQRSAAGYADGNKSPSLKSRIGKLALQVPLVRGEINYYPSTLERGLRSERAVNLAVACVPKVHLRAAVAEDIRSILTAPDREQAERLLEQVVEKVRPSASRLAAWMQAALPEGFTVFMLPQRQRQRLRTTNMPEFVNKEVIRRACVATLFPNEASLLRLVSAAPMEISEEWETGRIYSNPETQLTPD